VAQAIMFGNVHRIILLFFSRRCLLLLANVHNFLDFGDH
jgi:hypothetical protein